MPQLPSPFSIRPADGGKLITVGSPETVGATNYVEKTNWIRIDDYEERRHGTLYFRPNAGLPAAAQYGMPAGVVGLWEAIRPNGERSVVAATRTTIYRFNYSTGAWDVIGTGFSTNATKWEGENLDGYLVLNNAVDLLVTFRVEDSAVQPLKEMREVGIACVGTICVANGFLLCGDVTEIQSASLTDWMNGSTPYGLVPTNLTNRIRYKIAWPDYNSVTNWSPVIRGTIQSASKNKVTLDYPVSAFPVGTKLAIVGAGVAGGTLGGETGFESGVPVTAVAGAELTLGESANVSLTYPLTVEVERWTDVSTFEGSSSIQDDSSAVIRMIPLKRLVVVYRETGIWTGRYTAQVETPWAFIPEYKGANVPAYPQAITGLQGDAHVFATKNTFYFFDGAGDPQLFAPLDESRSLFFTGLSPTTSSKAFALHNPITRELWFFCPNGVLTYNYLAKTAEWIDEAYSAAAYIRKPDGTSSTEPSEFWFILSRANTVMQYGATDDRDLTYLRLGVPFISSITPGVSSLMDDMMEKDLHGYAPLLGVDPTIDPVIEVTLFGKDSVAGAADTLFTLTLDDAVNTPLIEAFFRNIYFQDRIRVTDTRDINVRLAGRSYYFTKIRSLGVTRNANGSS